MPGFGAEVSNDYTKVKNGSYPATVISAAVVMENGHAKVIKSDNGAEKKMVKVLFHLDESDDEGNPIELTRTFGLTYGKNRQTGAWSGWAQFLEAATHVVGGDKAQYHIGNEELAGKRLSLRIKNVTTDQGSKFSNVVDFEPIDEEAVAAPAPVPAPRPVAQAQHPHDAPLDEEVPF